MDENNYFAGDCWVVKAADGKVIGIDFGHVRKSILSLLQKISIFAKENNLTFDKKSKKEIIFNLHMLGILNSLFVINALC